MGEEAEQRGEGGGGGGWKRKAKATMKGRGKCEWLLFFPLQAAAAAAAAGSRRGRNVRCLLFASVLCWLEPTVGSDERYIPDAGMVKGCTGKEAASGIRPPPNRDSTATIIANFRLLTQ